MIKQFPLTFALMLERKIAATYGLNSFPVILQNMQLQRLHKRKAPKTYIKIY